MVQVRKNTLTPTRACCRIIDRLWCWLTVSPGEVPEALDYYSKGVTELEKGVSYRIDAHGKQRGGHRTVERLHCGNGIVCPP